MSQLSDAPKESKVDVLIIGAGPAGLMCANALVQAGVDVRIVDKRPEGLKAGQADGLHPRTLEIFQSYGLAERLFKEGAHIWRTTTYNPSGHGEVKRTSRSAVLINQSGRYPYGIALHQGGVEDILLDSMKQKGLTVDRATVPTSIRLSQIVDELNDPQAYVNTVTLEHLDERADKAEVVHAKFVLGSDGAHSWVRKALGITAEGSTTGSIWGVVDLLPDTDLPDIRSMTYIHSEQGTMFLIPRERDLVRLYVQQPDNSEVIDPTTGRVDKNKWSPEKILGQAQKMLRPYYMGIKDGHVEWWTVYVVGQRVAEKYSVHERALIAGDACHTHSPKAGQGMNAALGDTHNLGWKLAYVLKGWAKRTLLQTYESERRKFAQDLIEFDKKWSKLFTSKAKSLDNPDGVSHEQFLAMAETFNGFMSGIGIRYGPSIIVNPQYQSWAPGLLVGARVPPQEFIGAADGGLVQIHDLLPADTRFKVLFFGGDVTVNEDAKILQGVGKEMIKPDSFIHRFGQGDHTKVFDILCFSHAKQETADYLDFPPFFRSHWSKLLLDAADMQGRNGSGGYAKYGIDVHGGAIVVVRPDGYVGMIAPLDRVDEVTMYFSSFLA
ncbi:hypothetical protein BV20DRAFT_974565 [Pilatotrama ljubarskyi]|nr:hypothetical protein BV20DRAFT_974565 [Pilatotrama ljubarskyi]